MGDNRSRRYLERRSPDSQRMRSGAAWMKSALVACALLLGFIVFLPRAQAADGWTNYAAFDQCSGSVYITTSQTFATGAAAASAVQAMLATCGYSQTCVADYPGNTNQHVGIACNGTTRVTFSGTYGTISEPPPPTCEAWQYADPTAPGGCRDRCAAGAGQTRSVAGSFPAEQQTTCVDECTALIGSGWCAKRAGYCSTTVTMQATTCTGLPGPQTGTDQAVPGEHYGKCPVLINGTTVWLTCGKEGTTPEAQSHQETTNADGTKEVTRESTKCVGAHCTTTVEKTSYDGTGAATGTESSTKQSSGIPGITQGGGDECDETTAQKLRCAELGTPDAGPTVGTSETGPSAITPAAGIGGAGSCPASIALPHGAEFSFDGICDWSTTLRPLVIALAWLGAGMIVFGGFRRG